MNEQNTAKHEAEERELPVAASVAFEYNARLDLNTVAANGPCPVCGGRTDPITGVELFYQDAPVCDACGARYAPTLYRYRAAADLQDEAVREACSALVNAGNAAGYAEAACRDADNRAFLACDRAGKAREAVSPSGPCPF